MQVWLGEHSVTAEQFTLGFAGHAELDPERAAELLRDPLVGLQELELAVGEQGVTAHAVELDATWTPSGTRSTLSVVARQPQLCIQALEALAANLVPQTVTLAAEGDSPCAPVPFMPEGVLFVRQVFDTQTDFQRIQVGEHPLYGSVLFLNGEAQIASSDVALYTDTFVGGATRPGLKRAMVLGGGDCGVVKALLRTDVEEVLMIEIDEQVVHTCVEHFPEVVGDALTNPRATIQYGDAFAYLQNEAADFDLIVYDLSDAPLTFGDYGPVLPMIHAALAPGGRVAMQCGSGMAADRERLDAVLAGLRDAFGNCETREVDVPSFIQRPWVFAYADKS